MMRRRTASLTGLAALAASVLLLAGCASPQASSDGPGGSEEVGELEVSATWLDGGRVIGLVTQGSSTCVPNPTDVTYENGQLTVTLQDPDPDAPCTRDIVSRLSLVSAPEGIDSTQPLDVSVTYGDVEGGTDLEGIDAASASTKEGQASAAWVADNEIALLTWGSSSRACYPAPESVAVDAGVIRVVMATPSVDLVCTADFSAQGTIVFVDGASDDDEYELALTGHGFDTEALVAVRNAP